MLRRQGGFTLVELMVTMVIFVLAIAAASNIFSGLVNQFKQQSRVAQTNIEGILGLELLRNDLEQAGFGLPWSLNGAAYSEASGNYDPSNSNATIAGVSAGLYNDATSNPPRAIVTDIDRLMNDSDVLVIKATNVAMNEASNKWTYIENNDGAIKLRDPWGVSSDDLDKGDKVIVITPSGAGAQRILINSGQFWTNFSDSLGDWNAGFLPGPNTNNLVYGIKKGGASESNPRMPFNRADYYVKRPPSNMPQRCAPGTGILYKGTVNHADGGFTEYPLLDCVVTMKTLARLDSDGDGNADTSVPNLSAVTGSPDAATAIRTELKEMRVYVLAQEGQVDANYRFRNQTPINDPSSPVYRITDPDFGTLDDVDLKNIVGERYANYRWKLYTVVVTPYNLR